MSINTDFAALINTYNQVSSKAAEANRVNAVPEPSIDESFRSSQADVIRAEANKPAPASDVKSIYDPMKGNNLDYLA